MRSKIVWGIAGILTLTFLLFLAKAQTAPLIPQRGSDAHDQLMGFINQARAENGLPPLKRNEQLNNAADGHSQNMAERNFAAHCDLDTNTSPQDRMIAAGYSPNISGENIGWGYTNAASVFDGWRNSPPHWSAILNTNYREIGIGYFLQSNDQVGVRLDSDGNCLADSTTSYAPYHYWTLNFGRQNNIFPLIIENEAPLTESRDVFLYSYGVGWAQEMRLQNEGGGWSAWQPFSQDASWRLSAGTGDKLVTIELRNGTEVRTASDTIFLKDGDEPTVTPQYEFLPMLFNQFDSSQVTPVPTVTPSPSSTTTPTTTPTLTATPTDIPYTPTWTVTPTATPTENPPTNMVTLAVQKTMTQTSVYQIENTSIITALLLHDFYVGDDTSGTPVYRFVVHLPPNQTRAYNLAELPLPDGFVGTVVVEADQPISGIAWLNQPRGELTGQDLVMDELPAFSVATYQYEVQITDTLTVNVTAELGMDMVVAVVDENNTVLVTQNLYPAGDVEILPAFSLPISGTYDIWVYESGGNAGNYGIILQGQEDYKFVFKGTLDPPVAVTTTIPTRQDDFWHFASTISQTITITTTPNDNSDLFFELYDTAGTRIESVDEESNGDVETGTFTLDETGLYAIRVGEFDFLPANYTLEIAIEP